MKKKVKIEIFGFKFDNISNVISDTMELTDVEIKEIEVEIQNFYEKKIDWFSIDMTTCIDGKSTFYFSYDLIKQYPIRIIFIS